MAVITSINNFFTYCSNEVQLNKYSQKLAIAKPQGGKHAFASIAIKSKETRWKKCT